MSSCNGLKRTLDAYVSANYDEVRAYANYFLTRYVKGKTVWDEMVLELYDPVVPSGAQAVMEWVRLHHESVTGRDGYAEFYKKDITINVLGPVGDKVEEWILKGAQITKVEFGEMAWEKDEPASISLKIQPDFCILNY